MDSPRKEAMRCATDLAANLRGSSINIFCFFNQDSFMSSNGRMVDLPAPGGA